MLLETLSQPTIFLMLIIFGFLSGVFFDFSNFFWKTTNKNKNFKHILDFFSTLAVFFLFFLCIYVFNFGEIRAYEFFVFFSFFSIERFTFGKLVEKLIELCYNNFNKLINKIHSRKKENKDDKKFN